MNEEISIQLQETKLSDGSPVYAVLVAKCAEYDHDAQRLTIDAVDKKRAIRAMIAIQDAIKIASAI